MYLGVVFVVWICFLCYATYDNCKKKDIEEKKEFFFRRKSMREGLKKGRDTIIIDCIVWIALAGAFSYLAYNIVKIDGVRELWMGTGKIVDELPGVMLGGLGAITMLSAFIGFRKDTWVGMNGDTVLKKNGVTRRFKEMILIVGWGYLFLFLSVFVKNGTGVYEMYFCVKCLVLYGFISYLYLFIKCMWALIEIMTGNRIALKRIKTLYQEFWYSAPGRIECSGREEEIIHILLSNHKAAARGLNLKNKVTDVVFDTNIKEGDENRRYKSIFVSGGFRFVTSFCLLFFSIGLALLLPCYPNKNYGTVVTVFVCGVGCFVAISTLSLLLSKGVRIAAISATYGRSGYRFTDIEGKHIYVREVPAIENRYHRYVQATKSFLAFFLMHLKSGHEDIIKMIIKECKRKLKDNPERYIDIYILFVVMDYMYYRETKNFLDDIEIVDEHREYYTQIARAFAIDTMDDIFGDKVEMTMFDEYIAEREKYLGGKKTRCKNIKIDIAFPQNSRVSIKQS